MAIGNGLFTILIKRMKDIDLYNPCSVQNLYLE